MTGRRIASSINFALGVERSAFWRSTSIPATGTSYAETVTSNPAMGTFYAETVTSNPAMGTSLLTHGKNAHMVYAIDFGTGSALQIWGPDGSISKKSLSLPRVKGGKTPRDEFVLPLETLLQKGDVVVESPTVGSSGAEISDVINITRDAPHTLYTVSARAVKNYRKDNGLPWRKGARYAKDGDIPPVTIELEKQDEVHVEDAQIIHTIATEMPWRLRKWHVATPANRVYTSVRPSDKRGYRDERSDAFMRNLPPFSSLPNDIQSVIGVKNDYSRSMILPFAMALEEPFLEHGDELHRRNRFEKILGMYEHGYPSFYRRMCIAWMQENWKAINNADSIEGLSRETRKAAWTVTTRQIRQLFHLCQNV